MEKEQHSASPLDITVRFVAADSATPHPWQECLIYVAFEGDEPAIFYGAHDGKKWVGAMPWDSCGNGESFNCVALSEISGEVISWALFPKPNAKLS